MCAGFDKLNSALMCMLLLLLVCVGGRVPVHTALAAALAHMKATCALTSFPGQLIP